MINHQNFQGQYGNPQNATYMVPAGYRLVPDYETNPQITRQYPDTTQTVAQAAQAPAQNATVQISARLISDINEVRPNEVPSDGTPCMFLQSDYKAIYVKALNTNNGIDTVKYIPEVVQKAPEEATAQNEEFSEIKASLEELKKMVAKMNKPYYKEPYNQNHQKKED